MIKGVFHMRNSIEKRRQKLINKLVMFNIYKIEGKQLYEVSLSTLQSEYKKIQKHYHPHGEFDSIRWT